MERGKYASTLNRSLPPLLLQTITFFEKTQEPFRDTAFLLVIYIGREIKG